MSNLADLEKIENEILEADKALRHLMVKKHELESLRGFAEIEFKESKRRLIELADEMIDGSNRRVKEEAIF